MLMTREAFLTARILEATRDARIAAGEWDAETIEAASKSLLACAVQMRKLSTMVTVRPVPLDDSVPVDALNAGTADLPEDSDQGGGAPGGNGGGGVPVTSATPEPRRPSPAAAVTPERPVQAAELFASLA